MSLTVSKKRRKILKDSVLYDFQKKLLNEIEADYLLAADTGTGKTMMALHHYIRHSNGEPLLIVAPPQKINEGGWDREIEFVCNHYGIDIEYESLSYGVLARRWKEFEGWFVVYDECHYIKNPTSQRGKAGIKLSQASTNFLLLSATPSSNGWEDTIAYMIMFGHYKNKTQFLKQHAIYEDKFFGQRRFKAVVDFTEKDKLNKIYQSFSVSLPKEECLDLPGIYHEKVTFKKSTEYNKVHKDRVLKIDGELELYDTNQKLQHGLRFYANQKEKLKYTEMLAEGTDENIIIFYNFTKEKDELIKSMKKLKKKVYEVSGQKSEIPHVNDWDVLKNSVTIVQYQAGSAGIELQYANLVIIYTPTYSYQNHVQALGRAYRNGQTKKVTVYEYMTKETIEEAVYAALDRKEDFTEELFRKVVEV